MRLAAVTCLALALTACTSSPPHPSTPHPSTPHPSTPHPSTPKTSTPGTPTTGDLKAKLVPASAITTDKFTLATTSPVGESGAVGISGVYANADHKRVVSIIVIHFPSAADAQAGLEPTQTAAAGELTHNPASDTPVTLGQGQAHLYQGSNDTGPLSIIVFADGNYIVTMEFVSKTAGDDVPAKVVTDLAKAQDAKLKA